MTDININRDNCAARPRYGIILSPRDIPLPMELDPAARTELEIGFGNGEYTVRYARAHPDVLLFGLEVSFPCVLRCARRAAGLNNLKIFRTDARFMLRELFRDESLDKIYMNFPCPWSRRRHAHRRVTAKDFADGLAAVLKTGGAFELVTDDEPYALEVQARLGTHPALKEKNFEINPLRPVTTKYERKWLEQGKNIYRLTFIKSGGFTSARRSWPAPCGALREPCGKSEDPIMHIRTENPATELFAASLNGVSGRDGESRWAFGRHYAGSEAFLIETFSTDDEFEQRYYIRISERDGGSLVQLDKTANAFLTPSVRGALKDVAERLASVSKTFEA